MIAIETKYLKNEQLVWLRALDFIQYENVFLKNTIVDILKNGKGDSSLEEIEYFQNQFLNKDAIISLLRRDIAMQNKHAEKELAEGNTISEKILKKQDSLRDDMFKMEKEFSQLKYSFNKYLSKKN